MKLLIDRTTRTRKQIQDAHVRYLWSYVKYLIRTCTDENKLRRTWNILKAQNKTKR